MERCSILLPALLAGMCCCAQHTPKDVAELKDVIDRYPAQRGAEEDRYQQRFPDLTFQRRKETVEGVTDPVVQEVLRHDPLHTSGPHLLADSTCAMVRLLQRGIGEWARVNYIYLPTKSGSDTFLEARADSILHAIEQGWPFAEAAARFSMDGNAQRGGDLGWFDRGRMVSDFSTAVFNHHRGDRFTARVSPYGWYVVEVTEEPGRYEEVEYLLVRGPICP